MEFAFRVAVFELGIDEDIGGVGGNGGDVGETLSCAGIDEAAEPVTGDFRMYATMI